ncbi:hypothetical protein LZ012_11575 [Dechloromonas sp. XY25]|uniref:Uncharacterized protein n=1 Tax=Dechloromonas hankyongensis TaxID=2908002 RepID=A0ABS9K374_9RHOO|nr:hypothetical protein [Dechloromonas hankyongensis]MCG2577632.1 hypothetical protein [Dechloromonas hankyongensis]
MNPIQLSIHESERILFAAITANTPSYLMKRLRIDPAVQKAAQSVSLEELTAAATTIFGNEISSNDSCAQAYLIFGVVSFLPPSSRQKVLEVVDAHKINWGPQLLAEIAAYDVTTSVQVRKTVQKPQLMPQPIPSSGRLANISQHSVRAPSVTRVLLATPTISSSNNQLSIVSD